MSTIKIITQDDCIKQQIEELLGSTEIDNVAAVVGLWAKKHDYDNEVTDRAVKIRPSLLKLASEIAKNLIVQKIEFKYDGENFVIDYTYPNVLNIVESIVYDNIGIVDFEVIVDSWKLPQGE